MLGDTSAKTCGVISEPEVSVTQLNMNDKYILLGTDGLWDGITIEEAVRCFKNGKTAANLADDLIKAGLQGLEQNQIDDNITVVVVCLE